MGWEVEGQNKCNFTINKRRSYNKAEMYPFEKRKLDIEDLPHTNEQANERKNTPPNQKIN